MPDHALPRLPRPAYCRSATTAHGATASPDASASNKKRCVESTSSSQRIVKTQPFAVEIVDGAHRFFGWRLH